MTLKEMMHGKEVMQEYAKRRRRVHRLVLSALPIAIAGFVLAVILEADLGQEQSGLFMLGGMVLAFFLFAFALHTARCPSCNSAQVHKIAGGHWRMNTSDGRCRHCDIKLRP